MLCDDCGPTGKGGQAISASQNTLVDLNNEVELQLDLYQWLLWRCKVRRREKPEGQGLIEQSRDLGVPPCWPVAACADSPHKSLCRFVRFIFKFSASLPRIISRSCPRRQFVANSLNLACSKLIPLMPCLFDEALRHYNPPLTRKDWIRAACVS